MHDKVEVLKRPTRGRPRKDDPAPTRQVYRNHVTIYGPSPEALEEARRVAPMVVYATFEDMIRTKMVKESEPLILPGKRKSMRPTGTSMLEMFDGLLMVLIHLDD